MMSETEKGNIVFAVKGWMALNNTILNRNGSYDFEPAEDGNGFDILYTGQNNDTKKVGWLTEEMAGVYLRWGAVIRARTCIVDIQRSANAGTSNLPLLKSIGGIADYLNQLIGDFDISDDELKVSS